MNIISPDPAKQYPDLKFTVVENVSKNPIRFEMSYNPSIPKLRSKGRINTLYDMHDLMSKSLEIVAPFNEEANISTGNERGEITVSGFTMDKSLQKYGIYLAPDFPEFLLPTYKPEDIKSGPQAARNAITWGVVRSEPGTVSQDSPFRGTREIKARTREFIAYYQDTGRHVYIGENNTILNSFTDNFAYMQMKAQVFDNLVQYNIWSKTNYEAERLVEWFEGEYMDNYIGMFREAGIVQMHFDRRVRDDTIQAMKNGYHVRSVLYYIRTERIKLDLIRPIKQVELNINVENLQAIIGSGDTYIGSIEDDLVSRWVSKNQLGG
jgi:hypothetical protein